MDTVFIRGLRIATVIGVYDWERRVRQHVVLDLDLANDNRLAAADENLQHTLDYAAISARLTEFVEGSEFELLETMAEELAALLQREYGVPWLRLRLGKPGAVRNADTVGVEIERGERA